MNDYFKLFNSTTLFESPECCQELTDDFKKADRFFIRLIFIHWILVSTISGIAYNTYLFGFVSGGILFAISYYAYRHYQGSQLFRNIVAIVLLSFSIITIQQHLGRIEMHFHVFVALSFLTRYKDLMPVTIATVFIAVHHLVFNYLQLYNISLFDTPIMVFSYGCGLDIVLLHTFFVVFEWLVLIPIIDRQSAEFTELIEIQTFTNKVNEKLESLIRERTEKLHQSMLEAESANKMKSEFLANMSHEIRTPMNAIIGFTDLLENNLTDPVDKSYLQSIKSGSKSLLTIINDILDLSKIEAGKLSIEYHNVQLKNLITEIKNIFSIRAKEKSLAFEAELDPEIPEFMWLDEVRIRQILFNLLSNAIKFTHEGTIKIAFKAGANIPATANYDLVFEITDSGIGIPEDQQEKMFEAFVQKDGQKSREYGGTGLGLSIVKRLVTLMNGHIDVDSEEGKGTRFRITLHDVQQGRDDIEESIAPSLHYHFKPANIIIADDVEDNRILIMEYLKDYPFTLSQASNGIEVLEAVNDKTSLVLMDIRMPEMDGYEAAQNIQRHFNIPVLALTASLLESESIEANHIFDSYLQKPISKTDLLEALAGFLPYSEGTEIEENEQTIKDELPEDLIEILKLEVFELLELARNDGDMERVKKFANSVQKIAGREKNRYLKSYAQALIRAVDLFDIETIEKELETFRRMIKS